MTLLDQALVLPPSLNENLSCGVVGELWTRSGWRCYVGPEWVEVFMSNHAMTSNAFNQPKRAFAPEHTFSWTAPETGTTHTGAVYRNGVAYRQVNVEGRVVDFLLVDEETAKLAGYPDEGWIVLKEWAKEQ